MENYTSEIATLLAHIDELKSAVEHLRPLSSEQEQRIMQKFRLDWNYHSNAIEGNTLTFGETRAFLLYGITAKGKPFKDYLDIKGHNLGIDFLLDLLRGGTELTEADIRSFHAVLLGESRAITAVTPNGKETTKTLRAGAYKTLPNHVRTVTGAIHYYTSPEETPIEMEKLMTWYRAVKDTGTIHPVIVASIFHHRFTAIHPFDDGNGRLARLLMNFILMSHGYPPVVIRQERREAYYLALNQADAGELIPLLEYIGTALSHSLELYLKGARGESLEEPNDLDKELALLRRELERNSEKLTTPFTPEIQQKIIESVIIPLQDQLDATFEKFKEMFLHFERKTFPGNGLSLKYDNISAKEQMRYVYQLHGFKYNHTPFGIEAKVVISFDELRYTVYLTVNDYTETQKHIEESALPSPVISNYYHQLLDERDLQQIGHAVGTEILARIKARTNK